MILSCGFVSLSAVSFDKLKEVVDTSRNPFAYDLHLHMLQGATANENVLICLHGMGSDHSLVEVMKANKAIRHHLVGFNFPDYGSRYERTNMLETHYGTIDELLPVLYVWKRCVVAGGVDCVHLYGFSAGGGALVNAVSILNEGCYASELSLIGIGEIERRQMLAALEKGSVILEAPLKSFDELCEVFGERGLVPLAQRARKNGLCPIDNLRSLHGLELSCYVYFSNPDEALSNRDDHEYIRRLRQGNEKGRTTAIIGKSAGHTAYHPELWEAYRERIKD